MCESSPASRPRLAKKISIVTRAVVIIFFLFLKKEEWEAGIILHNKTWYVSSLLTTKHSSISCSKIARASQQLTTKLQNPMAIASLTMLPCWPCTMHYSATMQQPTSGNKLYEVTPSTRQDFDDGASERETRERTGRQYKIYQFSSNPAKWTLCPMRRARQKEGIPIRP